MQEGLNRLEPAPLEPQLTQAIGSWKEKKAVLTAMQTQREQVQFRQQQVEDRTRTTVNTGELKLVKDRYEERATELDKPQEELKKQLNLDLALISEKLQNTTGLLRTGAILSLAQQYPELIRDLIAFNEKVVTEAQSLEAYTKDTSELLTKLRRVSSSPNLKQEAA